MKQLSFVCPECHAESFNPNDIEWSYCGRCHKFIEVAVVERWKRFRELVRSF